MKIKIKLFDGQTMPEIIKVGEWIDLKSNADIEIKPTLSPHMQICSTAAARNVSAAPRQTFSPACLNW